MATTVDEGRLDETFAALASSTRRAILARLAQGAATVNELAEPFDLTLPAISKHIKVLERVGLVVRGQQAQFRPCALDAAPLREVSSWAEQYRSVWESRFAQMDDYLARFSRSEGLENAMTDNGASRDSVVIERSFDAPADLVWQMWTDPDHFKRWYGPEGATIAVAELDVRVGGTRLVCMEMPTPDGTMRMWFTGKHLEVVENTRLVYTESMSDEHGNVLAAAEVGLPEAHPTTTEVRVELEGHAGRTRLVMTHLGVPEGSPGAAGWAMAFDRLGAHVEAQSRR